MKYELLVSSVDKDMDALIKEMNIQSNAVIINQCNKHCYETILKNEKVIKIYSFIERGVGISRNSALMRSTADIIEFADDDMIFVEGYEEKVLNEFHNHPEADAILFSIDSMNKERPFHCISKFKKVGIYEARKYGCARLAIKREKLLYHNISFSLLFGGGAKYGSGEDTILINSLIKSGLKIYVSPVKIADVKQDTSSWYSGLTDKYYFDKGALMCALNPNISIFIALIWAIKHGKLNFKKVNRIFLLYYHGICDYKKGR